MAATDDADGTSLIRGSVQLLAVLIIILVTALIGGAILGQYLAVGVEQADPVTGDAVPLTGTEHGEPAEWTVSPTKGNGIEFTGNDSYAAASLHSNMSRGPWTACAWVEVDDTADLNETMDIAAADDGDVLLQFDDGQWLTYAEDGDVDAVVKAPATSPTTPTTVCGRYNGTAVGLWVNGSQRGTATLTTAAASRNVSVSFDGRADEVRFSNSSVSDTRLTNYAANPDLPWPGTNRVARFMFDEGSGDTTEVYFAGTSATLVNTSWTDGVPTRALDEGQDFQIDWNSWEITALQGGDLDGAPVVYVLYRGEMAAFFNALTSIRGLVGAALVVFGVTLLVIPAVAAISLLASFARDADGIGGFGNNNQR